MTPIELVANTGVFSSLPAPTIEKIAERLTRAEFATGARIIAAGQQADCLYIVESGLVGIFAIDTDFGHEVEIAQLGPCECIGELALITSEKRSATCRALSKTIAYRLDRNVFDVLLKQAPNVLNDLLKVLARRLSAAASRKGIPFISLAHYEPDPILMEMVPEKLIKNHEMVPVAFEDGAIILACVDPSQKLALDEIRQFVKNIVIKPMAVSKDDFDRFVRKAQSPALKAQDKKKATPPQIQFLSAAEEADRGSSLGGPEIMAMVNRIIGIGIMDGASDIHVEPTRDGTDVRFRVHGSLETKFEKIQGDAHKSLISRFKVLARLDITEIRKPQEGRISLQIGNRAVDLRLSLIPTKLGQKLVIRILDATLALVPLEELVLADKVRQAVREMFYAPHGVVLVTGPTGSGKTTTMYSALLERRKPEINIVTVEDPIEFHLDGLSQVEVGGNTGIDFATVLRSFLRQDPDIILVGETRDAETAKLALQAGLTGRLVFTSFHTNDAISTIVRLFEMGMEPFALGNSLVGVIHQRLIRRLCKQCREPYNYHPQVVENLRTAGVVFDQAPQLFRANGCSRCGGTGFAGRVSALEVLTISEKMRVAISNQRSPEEILSFATPDTFVTLPRYMHFLLKHGFAAPGEVLAALPRKGTK